MKSISRVYTTNTTHDYPALVTPLSVVVGLNSLALAALGELVLPIINLLDSSCCYESA